jgi:hypothetical protein
MPDVPSLSSSPRIVLVMTPAARRSDRFLSPLPGVVGGVETKDGAERSCPRRR